MKNFIIIVFLCMIFNNDIVFNQNKETYTSDENSIYINYVDKLTQSSNINAMSEHIDKDKISSYVFNLKMPNNMKIEYAEAYYFLGDSNIYNYI